MIGKNVFFWHDNGKQFADKMRGLVVDKVRTGMNVGDSRVFPYHSIDYIVIDAYMISADDGKSYLVFPMNIISIHDSI